MATTEETGSVITGVRNDLYFDEIQSGNSGYMHAWPLSARLLIHSRRFSAVAAKMSRDGLSFVLSDENKPSKRASCLAIIIGCIAPVLFPPAHIGILYYFWEDFSHSVDKHMCTCSCWDAVFKGAYESGVAAYKHLYFNATRNTFKIWVLTMLTMIALYECIRHLALLLFSQQVRLSMLVLFLSSIFAHYYSWWAYVNYWNDDYYSQWFHQMFFTATEVLSTALVVHLADKRNSVTEGKALTITGIALVHVLAGWFNQFVANVVRGEGYSHQVLQDLVLMTPDLLHVVLPLKELWQRHRKRQGRLMNVCQRKEFLVFILFVSLGFLVSSTL